MRVLFLDIDGVLNSHAYFLSRHSASQAAAANDGIVLGVELPADKEDHARAMIDPAAIEHLNAIVDASGAKIVISSSWRIAYTMGEIGRALRANGFRHWRAVIGKTPGGGGERGEQIDEWLRDNPGVEAFAILDDSSDMGTHLPRLIRTDYQHGLRAEHVPAVLAMLTAKGEG